MMDGSTIGFVLWIWILIAPVLMGLTTYTRAPNRTTSRDAGESRMSSERQTAQTQTQTQTGVHPMGTQTMDRPHG